MVMDANLGGRRKEREDSGNERGAMAVIRFLCV